MRPRWRKLLWIGPAAIVGIALFIAIGGEIVRLLWNWLTPMLFGWKQISFWQAVGILALCRILFGSHGFRGGHRSGFRRRMDERMWRRMEERWQQMTPEERERARARWGGRCGGFGPLDPPEPKPSV
ncbi:MAG TPA: hypothetical protein VIB39_00135 [Candidatus Angelobacter sp.]